uniref:Uncharacterized protein n=1 Tax=Bionectria ochroleuca TaxID=29856 RepID=A0A0B7KS67_BIOOC
MIQHCSGRDRTTALSDDWLLDSGLSNFVVSIIKKTSSTIRTKCYANLLVDTSSKNKAPILPRHALMLN